MTDGDGEQVDEIDYYPFGSTRAGDVPTDRKFTGQRLDGTGLYFYNARYYDPLTGRFISPDTLVPDPANLKAIYKIRKLLNVKNVQIVH